MPQRSIRQRRADHREDPVRKLDGFWIWHPKRLRAENCFICFRRVFDIDGPADVRQAAVRVSAQARYRLYVNGMEIGCGPNPSEPGIAFYDTYSVAKHLRVGRNCLAALAYAYGPTTKGVLAQRGGNGRFYYSLEFTQADGALQRIHSDRFTRCKIAPEYCRSTQSISWHLGEYKEIVDLRRAQIGWQEPDYDDTAWPVARELSQVANVSDIEILPREIPLFRSQELWPRNAYTVGFGHTYDCGADPRWEILGAERLIPGSTAIAVGTDSSPITRAPPHCTVRSIGMSGDPTLVIDFGRLANGQLLIELEAATDGATIRIGYGESLNITYVDTFITRRGLNHIRPFGRRHARFVFLTFNGISKPVQVLRVRFDHITYAVAHRAAFQSSDPLLDRVFEVSAETAQLCMRDHFEDCPWREQTLYAGDVHVEGLVAATLFGEFELTRKCLRDLYRTQRDDGAIAPSGPRWDRQTVLVDYVAHWCLALRNYVLYSGDLSLGHELYGGLQRALGFYLAKINARGLIESKIQGKETCFIDWHDGPRPAESPVLQSLVIGALNGASDLACWLDRPEDARLYRRRARELQAATRKWFFDVRSCLFRDLRRGQQPSSCSTRTNVMMALYGRIGKPAEAKVRRLIRDQGLEGLPKTPFMNFCVGRALGEMAALGDLLWLLRAYWGEMLNRGAVAWWEVFDPTEPAGKLPDKLWSLCHGWSAGPGFLLPAYVFGVAPLEPGWKAIRFRGNLGDLDFAQGTIPTPLGVIEVSLAKRRKPRIRIPKGMVIRN